MGTRADRGGSYAAALDKRAAADAALRKARLSDPDEHFATFDEDKALAALREGPSADTNDHPLHWYTSEDIIRAQAVAIEAERRWLEENTAEAKDAFQEAMRTLSHARATHRRGRPIAPVAVAGSTEEIAQRQTAIRTLGRSGFDPVTIANITQRPLAEVQGALNAQED